MKMTKFFTGMLFLILTGCSETSVSHLNQATQNQNNTTQKISFVESQYRKQNPRYCQFEVVKGQTQFLQQDSNPETPCYFKESGIVYFYSPYSPKVKLNGADAQTFELLASDLPTIVQDVYAKDKNHVYHQDHILEGADPQTFQPVANTRWFKDKKSLYFFGQGKDVDLNSFHVIKANFAEDNNSTYFLGDLNNFIKVPAKLDLESFQIMDGLGSYFKDRNAVYFMQNLYSYSSVQKIEGADPETFQTVGESSMETYEAKDKNFFYSNGEKINPLQ